MVHIPLLPALPPIQLAFAAIAVASAVTWKHRNRAAILFHATIGVITLFVSSVAYAHMVVGQFDVLHNYFQRFGGAFHLGFALYYYLKDATRSDPVINFAKAVTATIITVTRLVTAYELYEWKARGIHISQNYLGAVLLGDVVWAAVEIYRFVTNVRSTSDEIAAICKRTQRWIEGRTNQAARALFWVDAAAGLIYAIANIAYPYEILRAVIRREFVVDEFHALFVRDFAAHSLAPAVISLFAFHFPIQHQLSYIRQRVLTQTIVFLLHVHGHFVCGVYAPLHLLPFIVSFFYLAIIVSTYLRVANEFKNSIVSDDVSVTTEITTTSVATPKKGSKAT